jgi:hypothetical protein
MAVIFESATFRADPNTTATHVLLVGCEQYPTLAAAGFGGVNPLSSPRRSVEAMANWFLLGPDAMPAGAALSSKGAFFNPDAPLGSLEMLVSPTANYTTPAGASLPVTRSARGEIEAAYRRWLGRLRNNPNSRGVFYFCGHGVGDGVDQYLIADDFGGDPGDPWAAAFHVSNTCQATIRKTSAVLLFLIDACMEFSQDAAFQIAAPQPLINGPKNGTVLCTDWQVLRASTTNRLAYADPIGMARFTTALLMALKGHCGRQRPGPAVFWDVTASQLREATADFLKRLQAPGDEQWQKLGTPQGEGAWDVALHVLTDRPSALVEIDVDPKGFRPVALGFMEKIGVARDLRSMVGGPASFMVPWGEWTYGVCGGVAEQSCLQRLISQAVLTCSFAIA